MGVVMKSEMILSGAIGAGILGWAILRGRGQAQPPSNGEPPDDNTPPLECECPGLRFLPCRDLTKPPATGEPRIEVNVEYCTPQGETVSFRVYYTLTRPDGSMRVHDFLQKASLRSCSEWQWFLKVSEFMDASGLWTAEFTLHVLDESGELCKVDTTSCQFVW